MKFYMLESGLMEQDKRLIRCVLTIFFFHSELKFVLEVSLGLRFRDSVCEVFFYVQNCAWNQICYKVKLVEKNQIKL
jgi:hypothetical protein